MAASQQDGKWRRRLTWPWRAPISLVLLIGIAVLVATTIYGANRQPQRPPIQAPTASQSELYRPAATPSPDHPAPLQPALQDVIRQIQSNPDLSLGVAISNITKPQTRKQATLTAGTVTSGEAWHTIAIPMALAIVAQERQPEDRDYLFRRALASDSTAGMDAMWAFLGDPAQAAAKTTAQLREYSDHLTTVPQAGNRGYQAYLTTPWRLEDQAQYLAAMSCSYRRTQPVFAFLDEHLPAESFGLAKLPGAFVKDGQGLNESGQLVYRQTGILWLADGTEVAVALSVASDTHDDVAIKAALDRLASVIATQVGGFNAPTCG